MLRVTGVLVGVVVFGAILVGGGGLLYTTGGRWATLRALWSGARSGRHDVSGSVRR